VKHGLSVALAVGALATAATAHAQEPPALSATPASITLAANGTGTTTVANGTGVKLRLGIAVVDASGRSFDAPKPRSLPAGRTTRLTVDLSNAPGDATLVVTARPAPGLPRGAALRVPIAKEASAVPAVKSWTMEFQPLWDEDGRDLPLSGPCSQSAAAKGVTAVVQADGASHTVTGKCTKPSAHKLRLSVTGVGWDGREYSGTLKLGDVEVALTVEERWAWWLAGVIILIGLLAALGLNAWRGWGRGATDLLRRTYTVEQLVDGRNPAAADKAFASAAEELGLPNNVQGWTIADAVKTKLGTTRTKIRGWTDPKEEEVEAVRTDLEALEAQIVAWPEMANELARLSAALDRLGALDAYASTIRARTLALTGKIDLETAGKVKADVTEAVALAAVWPAEAIRDAARDAETLPAGDDARDLLDAALERMAAAADPVAAAAAVEDFWEAHKAIAQAKSPRPAAEAGAEEAVTEPGAMASYVEAVPTADPRDTAKGLGLRIALIDRLVVIFLVVVAWAAGMEALWIDESFGGAWDPILAFVWGAGAGAVATSLGTAIAAAIGSWRTR
jgi:hypothetical protein